VKTYKEREREREREREGGREEKGRERTRGTVGLVHHYSPKLNFSQWFV